MRARIGSAFVGVRCVALGAVLVLAAGCREDGGDGDPLGDPTAIELQKTDGNTYETDSDGGLVLYSRGPNDDPLSDDVKGTTDDPGAFADYDFAEGLQVQVYFDADISDDMGEREGKVIQSLWVCVDETSARLDVDDNAIGDDGYCFAPGGTLDSYGDESGDALAMKVVELDGAKQATLNEPQEAWVVIPFHRHGIKKINNLEATLDSTAVPGILTNSTDDPIAANNRQDYSFNPHVDCPTAVLDYDGTQTDPTQRHSGSTLPSAFYYDDTPQHDGSHGAIVLKVWCKDFGGNCEITFTSGTAELWGVTGTLDLSGLKVELPFTGQDAPQEPLPFWDWMDKELIADNCTWLQVYGDTQEEYRRDLVTIQEGQAGEAWTDLEPRRPGNPYAGFPEHLSEGDSLTLLQEYRGFTVTGGSFDANGNPDTQLAADRSPWGRYRVRLSPARKELLVKVDVMKGIDRMPSDAELMAIMDDTSKAFSNTNNGCGARLYYFMRSRVRFKIPEKYEDRVDLFASVPDLKGDYAEYVHLIFGSESRDHLTWPGISSDYGSLIHVDTMYYQLRLYYNYPEVTIPQALRHAVPHELTHLLLDEWTGKWTPDEHLLNPNDIGGPHDEDDVTYLMYPLNAGNVTTARFSNITRSCLDFTSKQSVERKPQAPAP